MQYESSGHQSFSPNIFKEVLILLAACESLSLSMSDSSSITDSHQSLDVPEGVWEGMSGTSGDWCEEVCKPFGLFRLNENEDRICPASILSSGKSNIHVGIQTTTLVAI